MKFQSAITITATMAASTTAAPFEYWCVPGYSDGWDNEYSSTRGPDVGRVMWQAGGAGYQDPVHAQHSNEAVANMGDESGCQALCEAVGAPVYNYMTQGSGGVGCRCYSKAQAAEISPSGSGWTFCTTAFVFGTAGTNSCPSGSSAITSENACKDAATALDRSFWNSGSWENSPKGCLTSSTKTNDPNLYFNTHSIGKDGHCDQSPVCQWLSLPIVPIEAPSNCPGAPSKSPSEAPSSSPTEAPSSIPTTTPTTVPTDAPSNIPTEMPTGAPSKTPSEAPSSTLTEPPSSVPTTTPTTAPTKSGSCQEHSDCGASEKCKKDEKMDKYCKERKVDCKVRGSKKTKRWGCKSGQTCEPVDSHKWAKCVGSVASRKI